MPKEKLTTSMLVTIEHEKPIDGLVDFVAQRAWNIDGVNVSNTKQGAVTARQVQAETFDVHDDPAIFLDALLANGVFQIPEDDDGQALELLTQQLETFLEVHGGCTIERPVIEEHYHFIAPAFSWWDRLKMRLGFAVPL